MDRVRILKKQRVFNDIFAIDEAVVEHRKHDGSWSAPTRQLCFERGDSVAVLLVKRETGSLVLVNQFRYPTYEKGPGWITEIVAGGLRDGESPEAAIAREVYEETGYEVENVKPIATFYVSPGGTSERVLLYHGEVGETTQAGGDKGLGVGDEDIKVTETTAAELWANFLAGRQQDAKTIIALLWWRLTYPNQNR